MSWVSRLVEQQLAEAAARGDLDDVGPLRGKPLPGIDQQRRPGWWADQFVARELSHDRRKVAEAGAAAARARFWRAETFEELRDLVTDANVALAAANINLVPADQLELFDLRDIGDRWRSLQHQHQRPA